MKTHSLTYSLQEAAGILGVSYLTAHRLVSRGILSTLPGLRHRRIPRAELERYIRSGTQLPKAATVMPQEKEEVAA